MIRKIIAHLTVVISVMMLTFYVIDSVNEAMGFLRGDVFKTLLLIYIIVSLLAGLFHLIKVHRYRR